MQFFETANVTNIIFWIFIDFKTLPVINVKCPKELKVLFVSQLLTNFVGSIFDIMLKRNLLLTLLIVCVGGIVLAHNLKVFKYSTNRYGVMRGDSVLVDPVYQKIGVHNSSYKFFADSISPRGYFEVYDGKRWNAIDTCGNLIFRTWSLSGATLTDNVFIISVSGDLNHICSLNGEPLVEAIFISSMNNSFGKNDPNKDSSMGYQVGTYAPDSAKIITLMDASLKPIASFVSTQMLTNSSGQVFEITYDSLYRNSGAVFHNFDGVETAKFETPTYFVNPLDVLKEKEYDQLETMYGVVPYFFIVEDSSGETGTAYFLDHKIASDIKLNKKEKIKYNIFTGSVDIQNVGTHNIKSLKKIWKKIKPSVYDTTLVDYHRVTYVDPARRLATRNDSIIRAQDTRISGSPVYIKDVDSKKVFMFADEPAPYNSDAYDEIIPIAKTSMYVGYKDSVCRFIDQYGHKLSYDYEALIPQKLTTKNGLPLFLGVTGDGKQIVSCNWIAFSGMYEDIMPVMIGGNLKGYYYHNDGKWAYATTSALKSVVFYDYIDEFDGEGRAKVYYEGFSGVIDTEGRKVMEVCSKLFSSGRDLSKSAAERIAIYDKVVEIASKVGENRYIAPSYINIAQLYEKAGDIDMAISNYELAEACGSEEGASNAKRLKNERLINTLEQVAGVLNNFATALGGNPTDYNITASNGYTGVGGDAYSSNAGSTFESQYRNWERRAKSIYESLTNTGYKTHKNGKDSGGSTAGGMSGGNFVAQKRLLREAQSEMKSIRRKASQQNIHIEPSPYETVTVNY